MSGLSYPGLVAQVTPFYINKSKQDHLHNNIFMDHETVSIQKLDLIIRLFSNGDITVTSPRVSQIIFLNHPGYWLLLV